MNHQFRAIRYGLFNVKGIVRFMKATGKEESSEKSITGQIPTITVFEAEKMLETGNFVIIDVRGRGDFENVHIWDSIHIEFKKVMENLDRIPKDKDIGVICYGGGASEYVTQVLLENGYPSVMNIKGGIIRWALDIDDELLEYL